MAAIVDLGEGETGYRPPDGLRRPRREWGHAASARAPAGPRLAERTRGPPTTTSRLDGLDAARGLAVGVDARRAPRPRRRARRTSPSTSPLRSFAVVIGVADGRAPRGRRPPGRTFLRDNALRGVLLVLLGVLLQALYDQIVVVLPYLGLLVIVLAPLALLLHRVPIVTLGVAAGLAVLSPLVMERAREWSSSTPTPPAMVLDLVDWLAAGSSYRVVSLLAMALGGWPSRPCCGGPPDAGRGSSAACSSS